MAYSKLRENESKAHNIARPTTLLEQHHRSAHNIAWHSISTFNSCLIMNCQLKESFDALYADKIQGWAPSSIIVAAELRDQTGTSTRCEINFMDYIGLESTYGKLVKVKNDAVAIAQGHSSPIVFPDVTGCDPASLKTISESLKKACTTQGFKLISKGFQKKRNRVQFLCDKRIVYKSSKKAVGTTSETSQSNKTVPRTFTKRPLTKEDACSFSFNLYFKDGNWRFMTGTGNPWHCKHVQKTEADMPTSLTSLDDESRRLLESSIRSFALPSTIKAVLANHSSVALSSNQIQHVAGLMRLEDPNKPRESPASRLLSDFRDDPTISFVAVYANSDSSLLSINNKGRPPKITLEMSCFDGNARQSSEQVVDSGAWVSHGESVTSYAQRVREHLKVDQEKILLGLAWTSSQEQAMFSKFPEVIAADVTLQTNTEKRPVFMVAGRDNCNQTFTFLKAYLPSESAWVFDWLGIASTQVHKFRNDEKARACATAIDLKPTDPSDFLRSEITNHAAEICMHEWESRDSYDIYRPTVDAFYVKRKHYKNYSSEPGSSRFQRFMVPDYQRTRVLEIIKRDSQSFLTCSCKGWERKGIPCRHMWSILRRQPLASDLSVHYQKKYSFFYCRDEDITELFDNAHQRESPGVIITPEEVEQFRIGACTGHTVVYFETTLPHKKPRVTPANYWSGKKVRSDPQRSEPSFEELSKSFLVQEMHLSQESVFFDHNKVVDSDNSDSCCAENESTMDHSEPIGQNDEDIDSDSDSIQRHWKHPHSLAWDDFGACWKEACSISDQSLDAYRVFRETMLSILPKLNAAAASDPAANALGQQQTFGAGVLSSNREVDKRKYSKRLSSNYNSPVSKKRRKS